MIEALFAPTAPTAVALVLVATILIASSAVFFMFFLKFLDKDDQLVIEGITEKRLIHGPKILVVNPFTTKRCQIVKATTLGPTEYLYIRDTLSGERRVEVGPKLVVFQNPYEEMVVDGEGGVVRDAISLKANEYVRFMDKTTGAVRVVHHSDQKGCIVPNPEEVIVEQDRGHKLQGLNLRPFEYIKILNKHTGVLRVEKGETTVYLGPFDEYVGSKTAAVEVDDETAVLVRNKRSGQLSLVTEKKLFFPSEDEEVLEVQKLVALADHEACIVRDLQGRDEFYFGREQRSFFLQPYSSLVTLNWSRGRRRERRDLYIKKIDMRPMYMSFEFNCRTSDNVELVLEGSFFWEIEDLKAMHQFTNDTTGDICNHARSRFIELVSKCTLLEFMGTFNQVAEKVHKDDQSGFYKQRGVKIHSLEVTGYHCAEKRTAQVLSDIIQETTNRINRLQQQESENEVQLREIQGDVEEEKARAELLEIQKANTSAKAEAEGQAEAQRVKTFLESLSMAFPEMETQKLIDMWQTLRKEDALRTLSSGNAQLYFTPADANISIERHTHE